MPAKWSMRRVYKRVREFILIDVLHADDTPHRIALGLAIGMFIAFTPTLPVQMLIIFCTSWLLQANKTVGVPMAWLTNPATVVPVFYLHYLLGCALLGREASDVDFGVLVADHPNLQAAAAASWELMLSVFWPLWIGSLVVASVLAVITYYSARRAIVLYRARRRPAPEAAAVPAEEERPAS